MPKQKSKTAEVGVSFPINHSLLFHNPVFKAGINTTIQRGVRWALLDGEFVWLCDKNEKPAGYGQITRVKVKRFCDITLSELLNAHDENYKELNNLYEAMLDIHEDFDNREAITLIDFEVKDLYGK